MDAKEAVSREEALLAGMRDEVEELEDSDPVGALLGVIRERDLSTLGYIDSEVRELKRAIAGAIAVHEMRHHTPARVRWWRELRAWLRR
jgi:hypothetical protein